MTESGAPSSQSTAGNCPAWSHGRPQPTELLQEVDRPPRPATPPLPPPQQPPVVTASTLRYRPSGETPPTPTPAEKPRPTWPVPPPQSPQVMQLGPEVLHG